MNKHEKIFTSYKRNHIGDEFEDVEKSKIVNERHQIKYLESKAKSLVSKALVNFDETVLDEVENVLYKSRKVTGNLNSHKTRLTELKKNKKFR